MREKNREVIMMSILCESKTNLMTDFSASCLSVPEVGFDAAHIEKLQSSLSYQSALYIDATKILH